jgi:hypothetical protein
LVELVKGDWDLRSAVSACLPLSALLQVLLNLAAGKEEAVNGGI